MSDSDPDGGGVVPVLEEEPRAERLIEPGRPELEHVTFVIVGVVLTILVFLRGFGLL